LHSTIPLPSRWLLSGFSPGWWLPRLRSVSKTLPPARLALSSATPTTGSPRPETARSKLTARIGSNRKWRAGKPPSITTWPPEPSSPLPHRNFGCAFPGNGLYFLCGFRKLVKHLLNWLLSALAVWMVAHLVSGFHVEGALSALIAALVIGFVN